jgi:hypothetical protein
MRRMAQKVTLGSNEAVQRVALSHVKVDKARENRRKVQERVRHAAERRARDHEH